MTPFAILSNPYSFNVLNLRAQMHHHCNITIIVNKIFYLLLFHAAHINEHDAFRSIFENYLYCFAPVCARTAVESAFEIMVVEGSSRFFRKHILLCIHEKEQENYYVEQN